MNVILGQLKYPVLPSMQMSTGTGYSFFRCQGAGAVINYSGSYSTAPEP